GLGVEAAPVVLGGNLVRERGEFPQRQSLHDPGPWVDGGNHPRVGLEAPELTTESKGIGTSAAPETIEGLDVEEEAANAGAKHIGGHAGLTHDVFALEDGPGMKRHA